MNNKTKFALVDCNNFYASCERVFEPKLEGRPIVVLSIMMAALLRALMKPKL